jgi:hypothetical protein
MNRSNLRMMSSPQFDVLVLYPPAVVTARELDAKHSGQHFTDRRCSKTLARLDWTVKMVCAPTDGADDSSDAPLGHHREFAQQTQCAAPLLRE